MTITKKIRYLGHCPRCQHVTEGTRPGLTCCKWGRCNGTPTLVAVQDQ